MSHYRLNCLFEELDAEVKDLHQSAETLGVKKATSKIHNKVKEALEIMKDLPAEEKANT